MILPDVDPAIVTADLYFQRLSHAGITSADWSGSMSWNVGYRIGRDGNTFPDRLAGNGDALAGFVAGQIDRNR